jgi:hypothetical protein
MTSHLTYDVSKTRADDFQRHAAEQRIAKEALLQPDASPSHMLPRPQRGPSRLRRVLRDLDPRPATR